MIPIIYIGPIALPVPELVIILGIWLGLNLAEKYSSHNGIHPNEIFSISLIGLASGVIGARLSYVARFPSAFAQNWTDLFSRNIGLLDPVAGFILGTIIVFIYLQRRNLNPKSVLDALTPAFAVIQIAFAVAHFSSGEAYGSTTNLPWSIQLWGENRHPSQVYEMVMTSLVLLALRPSIWWKKEHIPGIYGGYLLAGSSAIHLLLGTVRGDHHYTIWGLRIEQIAAWLVMAVSLGFITYLEKSQKNFLTQGE